MRAEKKQSPNSAHAHFVAQQPGTEERATSNQTENGSGEASATSLEQPFHHKEMKQVEEQRFRMWL